MTSENADSPPELSYLRIIRTWWPLAASWFLMGFEGPVISAVISRMAEPKINLAAYGGLVFPLALIIEAPIIMLLAASTALSRDWASYLKLRRFTHRTGAVLTLLHIIMVATPLYPLITRDLIHAPEEIIGPARIGLALMIPWTWAIAFRRFNQGVLIRFGHSLSIGIGTGFRLAAEVVVLTVTFTLEWVPGVAAGAAALAAGVIVEAVYARLRVRPVLSRQLKTSPPLAHALTTRELLDFYVPLSLTSLLVLMASPLGSAAMGRMPGALESLAAWPVVNSLNFLYRSLGVGYNESVLALVETPRSFRHLRTFAVILCVGSVGMLAVCLIPPVADVLFRRVLGLADPLPRLVVISLALALPMPAFSVLQSWFQGIIVNTRRTRAVTESVVMFLVVAALTLLGGALWGAAAGIFVTVAAFSLGELFRTVWLAVRSRPARRALRQRDLVRA